MVDSSFLVLVEFLDDGPIALIVEGFGSEMMNSASIGLIDLVGDRCGCWTAGATVPGRAENTIIGRYILVG